MLTRWILPLSMVCASLLANVGRSALVLRVDLDPLLPGIQANIVGSVGSMVTAGIFAELTETTSIATYNYSIQFDQAELAFASRSETPGNLTGLTEIDTSNPNDQATGLLRRFDGTTFANGPVGPFGPVQIAEVVFNVTAPTGNSSDIDIVPGRFEPLFDQFFDNGFMELTGPNVAFFGGSVSVIAIPEPTSLALIFGCAAAFSFRRRDGMLYNRT